MLETITVATCNYNTPKLLKACIASAKKYIKSFQPKFVVLDNSDRVKLDTHDKIFKGVQILDNTKGAYINFKKIIGVFGKCFDETHGSLKHAYSIQWLLNTCLTEKMILLDADVILKQDLNFAIYNYASVFDISQRKTYKQRALPYVQLFNIKEIEKLHIQYFDPTRIRGGTLLANSAKYDTGASFLEDLRAKKASFKQIDFSDYVYHLRSASFESRRQEEFLKHYEQHWKDNVREDKELQWKLVASLTSWAPRIQDGSLLRTLKSLVNQKFNGKFKIAVTLLAADKEKINSELVDFIAKNQIEVLIADEDLKPHKKYFYAMKKWRQLPIVTFDDDLVYESDLLQKLYNSYKEFPQCVSAGRVHMMQRDYLKHTLLPYRQWKYECKSIKNDPSMDLFATGCGGILYPENCLQISNADLPLLKTCLNADDVFLKKKEQDLGIQTVFVPLDDGNRNPYKQQSSSVAPYSLCFMNNTRTRCDNDIYIKRIGLN